MSQSQYEFIPDASISVVTLSQTLYQIVLGKKSSYVILCRW